MAKARQLFDGIDDPESFGVQAHLESPVARLAKTNGFKRLDRTESEERWVKKLSNGKEAWLRTTARSPYDSPEPPMDPRDPGRHGGGRTWEFLLVGRANKCAYCNNDRPATKAVCPHCKRSREVKSFPDYQQLVRGSEMVMNYLLGAILQRLATWPAGVPKPGEPGWKNESVDVDDPEAFVRS